MNDTGDQAATSAAPVQPTVLIVDDVRANLVALEALLQQADCSVVLASSGNEALRQLLKGDFAVMLLDVQMPHMDGYEVARHARSNPATRDVPIIFLTAARNDEDTVLKAYGTGAVDFLLKPISSTILLSKVRVFLELRRKRDQLTQAKTSLERTNSELQRAYVQLQSAQAQLVHSAKMASLGQLVAGIAHEVNNPLSFSLSHLNTALASLAVVESECNPACSQEAGRHWKRAQDRLREMSMGLDRIADLVVKLKTFSRLDEGGVKEVCVSDAVGALLTILGRRIREGVVVRTEFGEPDSIGCSPDLFNQAVMNIVINALDAIAERGTITITTGSVGQEYSIVVTDTGSGIPEHVRERIFEPFFTTKAVGKGTGLGLSLAYSVVQKHGGTLSLEAWEQGTRASIRIPLPGRR